MTEMLESIDFQLSWAPELRGRAHSWQGHSYICLFAVFSVLAGTCLYLFQQYGENARILRNVVRHEDLYLISRSGINPAKKIHRTSFEP